MDQTFIYDLGFVSLKRRPRTAPEIVFSIEEQHLEEVIDRLQMVSNNFHKHAENYLGESVTNFSLPIPDLFGNKEFGYHKCGYWTIEDGNVHFRLPLRPFPWTHYNSLTIFILTKSLSLPFEATPRSGRSQDVELSVLAERGRFGGYGHAVGGRVSKKVLNWLKSYARANIQSGRTTDPITSMHPEVTKAQQEAAGAIISTKKHGYRASPNQIRGWIRDSGAFTISCHGDACDLSIYYSSYITEGCKSIEFGCHNLDSTDQQLTLLAGLAKICQLARESS